MKKLTSVFLLFSLLLLGGCQKKVEKFSGVTLKAGFDTFVQLVSYTENQKKFDSYMQNIESQFINYNNLFDIYNDYPNLNNVKTINDNAGIQPVEVDPAIIEMLLTAKEFYELSNGEFDVTMGATLKIWHNYRDAGIESNNAGVLGKIPTNEELEEARACRGWQFIEIDETKNTVYINNPCVSLDVGGIAKGFATEKVAQSLENKMVAGIVNAGGNNRTMNIKPDKTDWVSAIENPNGGNAVLQTNLHDSQSFVTSGDYQRFYYGEDGYIYHHIIDPTTDYPANYYRSVSIVVKNSGHADALSTSLYTVNIETGIKIIEEYNKLYPNTPASAIWIMDKDNTTEHKNGFETSEFYIVCTDDLVGKLK